VTGGATSPRLLLFLFVLTGIAGMHTIGHPVDVGSQALGHAHAATGPGMPMADPEAAGADRWADEHHHHVWVMNPLNVCAAVLVGGILLLLAAMVCRPRRASAAGDHIMALRGRTGRGPPGFVLFGLTLADLSVQRT
jgi:Family of unknown function (DUF6153)